MTAAVTKYKPGTVVDWADKWKWCCLCTKGVPIGTEWMESGKDCVECEMCHSWAHIQCYGLSTLFKNEKERDDYKFICFGCTQKQIVEANKIDKKQNDKKENDDELNDWKNGPIMVNKNALKVKF